MMALVCVCVCEDFCQANEFALCMVVANNLQGLSNTQKKLQMPLLAEKCFHTGKAVSVKSMH